MARVVMIVLNDCRTDARVLREAATLAAAGHRVTIMARTAEPYAPAGDREARGAVEIRRVPVAAGWLRWVLLARSPAALGRALARGARAAARTPPRGWISLAAGGLVLLVAVPLAAPLALGAAVALAAVRLVPGARSAWLAVEWRLQWRLGVEPWTRGVAGSAPEADVLHAHDLRALPAALAIRDRGVDGRTPPPIVYDSHEIFVEAGANALRPRRARAALRRLEQRLAGGAAALVTVNDDVAAVLGPALDLAARTVVVRNCVPRWDPGDGDPGLLRRAAGVPAGAPLVLAHGSFAAHRGFDQLIAALRLPALADAHAVFLGSGPIGAELRAKATDPALGGRLHVLDAVPPDDLRTWIQGADVAAMPIQPSTLNHRLSTPNKLFEALGAGVPVVASDFAPMRRIVIDDPDGPLGAVCDPTDPAAIAAAIRAILDLDEPARADIRARCLRAAHARYAWETQVEVLLATYAALTRRPW